MTPRLPSFSHLLLYRSRGLINWHRFNLSLLIAFVLLNWLFQATLHNTDWSSSTPPSDSSVIVVCASDWYAPISTTINGSYRLQLKVPVDPTVATTRFDRVPSSKVVKFDSHPRLLSFEDMAEIEDQFWRLPVDKQVYQIYPRTLNMSDVVSRVKSCRAVPEVGSRDALFVSCSCEE
ncbi:unnamed protein product [Dibothriocephalus latus]|uniref:Uncharacterized protein n=1 Tax=Dibothriocephalus latus TaxID=60516 RepID=A0A3P6PCU0_DIBLA|nr:unnamed protein product [Dibothriocephalus latus]